MSSRPYESLDRRHAKPGAARRSSSDTTGDWLRHSSRELYDFVASAWRVLISVPMAPASGLWSAARPSHALLRKVDEVIDRHGAELVKRRAAVFRFGAEADPDGNPWDDEIARFVTVQLTPALDPGERAALERHGRAIHAHVAERVADIAARLWLYH